MSDMTTDFKDLFLKCQTEIKLTESLAPLLIELTCSNVWPKRSKMR